MYKISSAIRVLEKNRVQNQLSQEAPKVQWFSNSALQFELKKKDVIWNEKWQTSECDLFKNDLGIVLWNLKTALLWAQILTTEIIHHFGGGLFKTHASRRRENTVVFKFRAMKLLLVWQTPTWNSCRLGKPRHETPADLANPDMKLLPVWQTPTWNSCPFGKPRNRIPASLAKPWKLKE